VQPKDIVAFIDPAGGGTDELGIGVATALGPYIHLLDVAGLKGGLTEANATEICAILRRNKVTRIIVESNMGHGLFEINLAAILQKTQDLQHLSSCISGEYSTGQKERRIIDSMVSANQRHRLVVHQQVFDSDTKYGKQHSQADRTQYSLWHQFANITTDRNSLPHDDRLEAAAGAVRQFKHVLMQDENKAAAQRLQAASEEYLRNPMGYADSAPNQARGTRQHLNRRHGRRF
jgi:hypothetical protein